MARLHWRPDLCRRHPRPARSQRPPHRSRRRQPEAPALQTNCKGLTTGLQLAKTRPPARCPPARRHHLVSPGDIISESAGDFVGICTNFVAEGGLISYAANFPDLARRSATYAAK